jgi:hypothetical protein
VEERMRATGARYLPNISSLRMGYTLGKALATGGAVQENGAMRSSPVIQSVLAASLALLVVSCSATRHSVTGPTSPRGLIRYVLIVEDAPDGRVMHAWKPIEDFDLTGLQLSQSAMRMRRGIMRVSTDQRAYCEGRRQQCEDDCLVSSKPIPVGHLRYPTYRGSWRANKGWWCQEACLRLADMCNRGMGEWAEDDAAEFDSIDAAVDWIKSHRKEILAGTVIVIAGVAFVAAVAATAGGALILVPVVLLVDGSSGGTPATRFAGKLP